MLEVILLSGVLVGLALAGLGIKTLFKKNAELKAGCSAGSPELQSKGINCGCGSGHCVSENKN